MFLRRSEAGILAPIAAASFSGPERPGKI